MTATLKTMTAAQENAKSKICMIAIRTNLDYQSAQSVETEDLTIMRNAMTET